MSHIDDFAKDYNYCSYFRSLCDKFDPLIESLANRSYKYARIINGVQKCDDQTEKEYTDELYEYFCNDIIDKKYDPSEFELSGPEVIRAIQFIVFCNGTVDIDNISLESVFVQFIDYYFVVEQMQSLFDNAAEAAEAANDADE